MSFFSTTKIKKLDYHPNILQRYVNIKINELLVPPIKS